MVCASLSKTLHALWVGASAIYVNFFSRNTFKTDWVNVVLPTPGEPLNWNDLGSRRRSDTRALWCQRRRCKFGSDCLRYWLWPWPFAMWVRVIHLNAEVFITCNCRGPSEWDVRTQERLHYLLVVNDRCVCWVFSLGRLLITIHSINCSICLCWKPSCNPCV